jgi:hypothetical protein
MPDVLVRNMDEHIDGDGWRFTWIPILAGLVLGLVCAGAVADLARDRLRIGCWQELPGGEGGGSWHCGDSIGTPGTIIAIGGMSFVVAVFAVILGRVFRRSRISRAILALLAIGNAAWVVGGSWYATHLDPVRVGLWTSIVLPAAIACAVAGVLALAAAVASGIPARVLALASVAVFVAATIIQPGLAVSTLPCAGVMGAAALRTPPPLNFTASSRVHSRVVG